eukprot:CAMPEP_0113821344 /NCGR_PEP_ID=MMETSP0328-20130328/1691_1 /TAXON_ID=39455 /ORGANISM="Alexandrium minutum" /LENGTH=190 /DNA_ID=CAMNT_0000789275 /DNA_START=99 /DNA_END=672 /DNA_ORIENTATION=+ /assembly_acc=CAM_ASM_000350
MATARESVPSAGFADVPANPIEWTLTLQSRKPTLFGAGYFDDAGDIPGQPLLLFMLNGTFDPDTGAIEMEKVYDPTKVDPGIGLVVRYQGKLTLQSGRPTLTGTWMNSLEGTSGTFACALEDSLSPEDVPFPSASRSFHTARSGCSSRSGRSGYSKDHKERKERQARGQVPGVAAGQASQPSEGDFTSVD